MGALLEESSTWLSNRKLWVQHTVLKKRTKISEIYKEIEWHPPLSPYLMNLR
jgi:hypothetical protein